MPRWRRHAPASRAAASRWWPARCAASRSAAPMRRGAERRAGGRVVGRGGEPARAGAKPVGGGRRVPAVDGLGGQLSAHRLDHRLVVLLAEDRAAGDEGVGAGIGDAADVVDLDAAVDLEADVAAARIDDLAHALDLAQRRIDEALSAEAG